MAAELFYNDHTANIRRMSKNDTPSLCSNCGTGVSVKGASPLHHEFGRG